MEERIEKLRSVLEIDKKIGKLEELKAAQSLPGFWDNVEEANKVLEKIKSLETIITPFKNIQKAEEELKVLIELGAEEEEEIAKQTSQTQSLIEDLEFKSMFNEEADSMSCVLKINSGAGGTESQNWAWMLMRMYCRYAESHGYTVKLVNILETGKELIKTVTLEIEGNYAYGYLKGETGVHRLVRVSPYNAQGKRMTSFSSVFVTPLIDDTIEITIDPSKLTWDTFRSGGAGGQNVNKVESGVRLRYQYKDPYTGEEEEILIENTETRDQPKNKENALRLLKSQLYDRELQHRLEEKNRIEKGKKKIEWGSEIRSYVLDDRRIKDHRTGHQTSDIQRVLDGDLDQFIKEYLLNERKI